MVRKAHKLRPTMVRLPETLHRELGRLADLYERSLSAEIIYRLEQSLLAAGEAKEGRPEPAVADRLAAIETRLTKLAAFFQAQRKVMQEQDARLAPAREELAEVREQLKQVREELPMMRAGLMEQIRQELDHLRTDLAPPRDGEKE
jgi:DNA repair exonuclease SbcCD ATPase subunit